MRMRWLAVVAVLVGTACSQNPERPPPQHACPALAPGAMRWIPAGRFVQGEDPHYPEEGPPRTVTVPGFWIDTHELTNAEFAAFVKATGYRTMAERKPPVLPGAPPEMRVPGSAVFAAPSGDDPRWWRWVVGAQWRHPSGSNESIIGKDMTPVVQIAYEDAEAYARWAGKALPSEAQWEYAARGGQPALPEPIDGHGTPTANYYQGVFPARDLGIDGLYDMIGNVWEWTSGVADPEGDRRVIKGGSYLCAANYCARYRPAARQFQELGLGTDHIGVRLVDNRRAPPH